MGHILAWICLVLVASTTAYGLQLITAAMVPPAETPGQVTSATWSSQKGVVTIIRRDALTGERQQVQCTIDGDRVADDTLVMDLKDFPEVVRAFGVCSAARA